MPGHKSYDDFDESLQVDDSIRTEEPKMYRVLLHNDNYTTMEFVVEVLMKVFHMTEQRAMIIMMDVHKKGMGTCGVYTFDIAATRVQVVSNMAREREFPLMCSYEEA